MARNDFSNFKVSVIEPFKIQPEVKELRQGRGHLGEISFVTLRTKGVKVCVVLLLAIINSFRNRYDDYVIIMLVISGVIQSLVVLLVPPFKVKEPLPSGVNAASVEH